MERKPKQQKKISRRNKGKMNDKSISRTQELTGVPQNPTARNRGCSRNSWGDQHIIHLLGEIVELDKSLDRRLKWGQRSAAVCFFLGVLFFIGHCIVFDCMKTPVNLLILFCSIGIMGSLGGIYYKNFSFAIARRLLKEVNVVVIVSLGITVFFTDCFRPNDNIGTSQVYGCIYLVCTLLFVFLDAVKKKSRTFVLVIAVLFVFLNMFNVYNRTFNGVEVGIILFKYGDDYVIYQRSVKRSCFLQTLLFSIDGVWTLLNDKKMEMMMFATGKIYRETGTASKHVEEEAFVRRVQNETSMV